MEELQALIHLFEQLPAAAPGILRVVFTGITTQIEDFNIAQLDRGERSDGSSLPNYSPVSVYVYGKKPGPMNLHNTGAFWRGIEVIVHEDYIEFVGKDVKTGMLQVRYGEDILGTGEESNDMIVVDFLEPEFATQLLHYFSGFVALT